MQGTWVRAGVLVALLAAAGVVALTVDLPDVATVRGWVDRSGVTGLVLLTLGVGIALLAPVPRTALSLLVGVVLGFWGGFVVAVVGAVLGGLGAFGLARWLGRDAVTKLAGRRLAEVDRRLVGHGFGPMLLVRISPVPFMPISYAAGLTAMRVAPYTAATGLGVVPGSALQVAVGASVGGLPEWVTSPVGLAVEGVVVLALVAAGVMWWRWTRSHAG
ncbi:TVP38/TMEM64 family protein [Geodermatophilus sp. SYSU D01119]